MGTQFKWSLIGIPDDAGVLNVGGRLGSSQGPRAFRKTFAKMNGRALVRGSLTENRDVPGVIAGDPGHNHRLASDLVREVQSRSPVTVVVGGGHDHGFSHLRGISEAFPGKKLGCINIDAHLDVRKPEPLITSGSPFYLAIESGVLQPGHLVEFGIQSHCNAPALWDYIDQKGVQVVPWAELRGTEAVPRFKSALERLARQCDLVVISLDLDAASSVFAPGVSAPQAEGFNSSDLIHMMEEAGKEARVCSLGIFELNPAHDIDDRTARLGATAAWHFIEQKMLNSSRG